MPCYKPRNVRYIKDASTGKNKILWRSPQSLYDSEAYYFFDANVSEIKRATTECAADFMQIGCYYCIGCRLERARQWAIRCSHEASMYEDNSFITLTVAPKFMDQIFPLGSLNKREFQLFMKRLRKRFSDRTVRVFYCGEYGAKNARPHYHAILFNLDFSDKQYWKTVNGNPYYISEELSKLWPYGHVVIGEANFETAAYIARYSLKKSYGKEASSRYTRVDPETGGVTELMPEFCQASLKPGIGKPWFDKYGMTDIFPRDECVIRKGIVCKPPKYYDKLLERVNPDLFAFIKASREEKRVDNEENNVYSRLQVSEKIQEINLNKLVRILEQ